MFSKKRIFGNSGEDVACFYLKKAGYKIIDRNYQLKYGELDIVAEKNSVLIFIEVKTSNPLSKIPPEENFTAKKLFKMQRIIDNYLILHKHSKETLYRLDLIAVKLNKKKAIIKHFKNINF